MKEIKLTRGKSAIVDDEDYEVLSKWKWYYQSEGYACRTVKKDRTKTVIFMHRFIMDAPSDMLVDHANRDRLDNRKENLRLCSWSQSNHNKSKHRGRSRYYGVSWDGQTKKWRSMLRINGRIIRAGRFSSEEEAARAFDQMAREHFGAFAALNFPEGMA